jgi:beta-N-acetylhexosaminidase
MGRSPAVIRRRQAAAIGVAVAATALIWLLLFRGDNSSGGAAQGGGASGAKPQVARVESQLTLPQMVDQVMLVGFDGTKSQGDIETELRSHQMGGVLVGPSNWPGAKAGAKLVGGLRADGLAGSRVAPLIVAQQEGGSYRSFKDLPPVNTEFQIGTPGKPALVQQWAREAAASLRAEGFDLDLFPVADLTGPTSPVRDRGFSANPEAAAAFTAAAIRGCIEARMACAPSHFPGLGSASQDTDEGPATVATDTPGLLNNDILPFKAAFQAKAPAVVMSLAFYAAYDPVTPGALSDAVATGLLRNQLHYKGAAITDDLEAGAIRATESVPQAAVEAIAAGSDMVQVSAAKDVERVRQALMSAAQNGTIPQQRLADAAARVLELKRQVGLLRGH